MTLNKFYDPQPTMSGGEEQIPEAILKQMETEGHTLAREKHATNAAAVFYVEGAKKWFGKAVLPAEPAKESEPNLNRLTDMSVPNDILSAIYREADKYFKENSPRVFSPETEREVKIAYVDGKATGYSHYRKSKTEPAKEFQPAFTADQLFDFWSAGHRRGWAEAFHGEEECGRPDFKQHCRSKGISLDAAPHPEPSEQSQGAFLEFLEQEEREANYKINLALGNPTALSAQSFYFEKLQVLREKYLSLHAQPKDETLKENGMRPLMPKENEVLQGTLRRTASLKPEREEKRWDCDCGRTNTEMYCECGNDAPSWWDCVHAGENCCSLGEGCLCDKEEQIGPQLSPTVEGAEPLKCNRYDDGFIDERCDEQCRYCAHPHEPVTIASLQSQLSEAREDNEANIKRALEITGERDRAIDEAQEYRKALEFVKESSWGARHQNPIKKAVCDALDKYPSPKQQDNE